MISLGSRYIDYGLTGGFFIFLGLTLFGAFDPADASRLVESLADAVQDDRLKGLETLLNGILGSLFVVCVFAVGLFLDLLGSMYFGWEADVLRRHIERNLGWIAPLLGKYRDYLGDDVDRFRTLPDLKDWRSWFNLRPSVAFRPFKLIPQFGRIESILLSHLLLNADHTKIQAVLDAAHTCRLARAISAGAYIMLIVLFVIVMKGLANFSYETGRAAALGTDTTKADLILAELVLIEIGMLGAAILSTLLVRRAYSRFCAKLFSTIYVLSMTARSEKSGSEPPSATPPSP